MNTRVAKRFFLLASLVVVIVFFSTTYPAPAKLVSRKLTDEEYQMLRRTEGVYQQGRNYNIIIDGHGTGLRPPTEEEWRELRKTLTVVDRYGYGSPPPSFDNSSLKYFPPVGNQGGEGSCTSWACVYYTKTFQKALEHDWDLSGCVWEGGYWDGHPSSGYWSRIFSPDFIYHLVNGGEDEGSSFYDNMVLLRKIGCCTWARMPYDWRDHTTWPDEDAWREAPLYRSKTGLNFIRVKDSEGIVSLKRLLADSNLALISVDAEKYDRLTENDLWTVDNYQDPATNHANTVVGYDDNFGPYMEEGEIRYGAFKVVNSWSVGGGWENVADGFLLYFL